MRKFDHTERYVLLKVYTRQRIDYWEKIGYVPIHQQLRVKELIGRPLGELLPEREK